MQLRCLAGAYAGQIQNYSAVSGLAALRSGTAEPIDPPPARARQTPPPPAPDETSGGKKKKHGHR